MLKIIDSSLNQQYTKHETISQINIRYKVVPLLMRVHPLLRSFLFTKITLLQHHFLHLLNTILEHNFTSQIGECSQGGGLLFIEQNPPLDHPFNQCIKACHASSFYPRGKLMKRSKGQVTQYNTHLNT